MTAGMASNASANPHKRFAGGHARACCPGCAADQHIPSRPRIFELPIPENRTLSWENQNFQQGISASQEYKAANTKRFFQPSDEDRDLMKHFWQWGISKTWDESCNFPPGIYAQLKLTWGYVSQLLRWYSVGKNDHSIDAAKANVKVRNPSHIEFQVKGNHGLQKEKFLLAFGNITPTDPTKEQREEAKERSERLYHFIVDAVEDIHCMGALGKHAFEFVNRKQEQLKDLMEFYHTTMQMMQKESVFGGILVDIVSFLDEKLTDMDATLTRIFDNHTGIVCWCMMTYLCAITFVFEETEFIRPYSPIMDDLMHHLSHFQWSPCMRSMFNRMFQHNDGRDKSMLEVLESLDKNIRLCNQHIQRFGAKIFPSLDADMDYLCTFFEVALESFELVAEWNLHKEAEKRMKNLSVVACPMSRDLAFRTEDYMLITFLFGSRTIAKACTYVRESVEKKVKGCFDGWQKLTVEKWGRVWPSAVRTQFLEYHCDFIRSAQAAHFLCQRQILPGHVTHTIRYFGKTMHTVLTSCKRDGLAWIDWEVWNKYWGAHVMGDNGWCTYGGLDDVWLAARWIHPLFCMDFKKFRVAQAKKAKKTEEVRGKTTESSGGMEFPEYPKPFGEYPSIWREFEGVAKCKADMYKFDRSCADWSIYLSLVSRGALDKCMHAIRDGDLDSMAYLRNKLENSFHTSAVEECSYKAMQKMCVEMDTSNMSDMDDDVHVFSKCMSSYLVTDGVKTEMVKNLVTYMSILVHEYNAAEQMELRLCEMNHAFNACKSSHYQYNVSPCYGIYEAGDMEALQPVQVNWLRINAMALEEEIALRDNIPSQMWFMQEWFETPLSPLVFDKETGINSHMDIGWKCDDDDEDQPFFSNLWRRKIQERKILYAQEMDRLLAMHKAREARRTLDIKTWEWRTEMIRTNTMHRNKVVCGFEKCLDELKLEIQEGLGRAFWQRLDLRKRAREEERKRQRRNSTTCIFLFMGRM